MNRTNPDDELRGKVAMVTGANSGMGKKIALALAGKGATVVMVAVEPGFVKTNLKVPFPFSLFSFMRGPAAEGAKPTVFLAASAEVEGVSGSFFNRKGVATESSKLSQDEGHAKRLWLVSAELTHLEANRLAN